MGPITVSVKMRLEEYDTYNSATGPSRGEGVDKVFAGLRCTSRDPSSATGPSIDTGDPGDPRVSDDVATETVGTDAGQGMHYTPPYPAHFILHGAGLYGLQCLANLDLLPPTGAVLVATPLKIKKGTGSPLRVIALIPGKTA